MLAGLERHQRIDCCGYEQRVLWCWTEEAAPWISQQLLLLVFHIACMVLGTALCWCWQCLLTVGGNLLPHTVTPFDVTTVAWCCRQTPDVLHPAECPPAALQSSQWQWTASVFTTWHCTGSYSSLKVSVLSCWRLCLGINFHHCFPHFAAANITVTQNAPRYLPLIYNKGCKEFLHGYRISRWHLKTSSNKLANKRRDKCL